MIVHPEERVADFAKAGSDIISVHAEPAATIHLDRTINQVGCLAVFSMHVLPAMRVSGPHPLFH